ncbi:hypothetical protein [Humibacillus xanthopallidus]|uniref:Uncharacterized protein n=1 Tax=Humibacillus xanthopallidus TaxID=412689 RepID=A0A543HX81_9MICO|nr:hypothetical protein [Humibacillus xanthopallidus]TQM62963.1 hypothetical protein FBY41_3008 [Humibacillus xanthopallidus]
MTETPADQPATTGAPGATFTDDEHGTLRSAALLAGALVSRAEKGMFDSLKESFAASKAIAGSPPQIAALVGKGGFPELPKGTPEQVEARTLELLGQAVAILRAKAPDLVDGYRAMVLASCRDAAAAADDTSGNEQAAIAKVEAALT